MARLVSAEWADDDAKPFAPRERVSFFSFRLLACVVLAVAYGCAAPPYGDGQAPARLLSSRDAPRFGSAAIIAPATAPETPPTEGSEAARPAAPEAASLPDDKTTIVPTVQAKPGEGATPAPQRSAEPDEPAAPSESDMLAASSHRPEELIGLKPSEVTKLLGHPSLVRYDVPAQVWQYSNRDCVLDVYLYPPAGAGTARGGKQAISDAERAVVYYELRGKNAKRLAGDRCFISIVAARGGRAG